MKAERAKRKQPTRLRIHTQNVNYTSGRGGRSIAADIYDAAKRAVLGVARVPGARPQRLVRNGQAS